MSKRYVSRDKRFTVSVISVDGVQRIRIEHRTPMLADGTVPVHTDHAKGRTGPVRTANGYLVADVKAVTDAARYVPLSELQEEK